MDAVLLLISGASGSGKTSVRQAIAAHLEPTITTVELRHLGAVPDPPTLEWRQRMAEEAVLRAAHFDGEGRHLLLAGDPVAPGEVLAAPSARWSTSPSACSMSVSTPSGNGSAAEGTPRSCFARHVAFADWLRGHAIDPRHMTHVLSTDGWSGDAVVTVVEHAVRPVADERHRWLRDDQDRDESGCAAVGYRCSGRVGHRRFTAALLRAR